MYKIKIDKSVVKFLGKQPLWLSQKFESALMQLKINPFKTNRDIKKLKGFKNDYRLRIGKYRLLYAIIENRSLIHFYHASSRGDIY